jgi:hypothetical protein
MERELKTSGRQNEINPSLKIKSQKLDYPIWDTGVSGFSE